MELDPFALVSAVFILVLAAFVGYEVVSKVPTMLHTPLMSGANAVHGVIVVGAMLVAATADTPIAVVLAFVAVVLGTINVVGGFVVTDRMLEMFRKRPGRPRLDGHARAPDVPRLADRQRHVHPRAEVPRQPTDGAHRQPARCVGHGPRRGLDLLHDRGDARQLVDRRRRRGDRLDRRRPRGAARPDDRDAADGRDLQRRGRWSGRAGRGRRVPPRHRAQPGRAPSAGIRHRDAARRGHRLRQPHRLGRRVREASGPDRRHAR